MGRPFSKVRVKSSGSFGALVGSTVNFYISLEEPCYDPLRYRLVRAVGEVLVNGPWITLRALDRDVVGGGVVEQVFTTLELVIEGKVTPRCEHLDAGL